MGFQYREILLKDTNITYKIFQISAPSSLVPTRILLKPVIVVNYYTK